MHKLSPFEATLLISINFATKMYLFQDLFFLLNFNAPVEAVTNFKLKFKIPSKMFTTGKSYTRPGIFFGANVSVVRNWKTVNGEKFALPFFGGRFSLV